MWARCRVCRGAALAFVVASQVASAGSAGRSDLICPADVAGQGACMVVAEHGPPSPRPRLRSSRAPKVALLTTPAASASAVGIHGSLHVKEGRITSNRTGLPVRLRGMSFFWSQWMPQFWTRDTVYWLRDDWNATLVRAAMAVEHDGYLQNPAVEKARVRTVVEAAIAAGMYVIIDWHDHNAEQHLAEASAFFDEMAAAYGQFSNVLFEVFNEPVRQDWATVIKPYHEELARVIRKHSNNLIILGTRLWSQEVDEAAQDPVAGENLAYTLHFYASTHRQWLREKVVQAMANGIAIFATEWGTCDATGDGSLDLNEAQAWLDFFERHSISDANWAIGDKQESCSALMPGASGAGGWDQCHLTDSGFFVRAAMRHEPPTLNRASCPELPEPPSASCSESGEDCRETSCCVDPGFECFEKDAHWAGCRASCAPGLNPMDPPEHQTPWSCRPLVPMFGAAVCSEIGEECSLSGCCNDLLCHLSNESRVSCKLSCVSSPSATGTATRTCKLSP